jgi:CRISPR-associated protein Csd1
MSVLAALTRAFDRLPLAPRYGFSSEKIGFCVVLNPDGSVADVKDLRDSDKKRSPRVTFVPQAVKRTVGIAPNFLWDKTAYVLGVTAGEGKRTAEEHATFRARHMDWLAGCQDEGLLALTRFLQNWSPDAFAAPSWPEDMRDQNIVFALAEEYRDRFCMIALPRERCGSRSGQMRHPSRKSVWCPATRAPSPGCTPL